MATRSGGVASVLATMFFLAALAVLVVVLFGRSPTLPPASHARAGTKVASKRAAKAVTSSKISTSTTSTSTAATTTTPVPVTVPNIVGLQRSAAQDTLRGVGLVSEVKGVPSIEPEGTILGQSPGAGTSAQRGSHVYMTVASGARPKSD
jgi:beta-lactam-binding protein with PASTA domain